MWLKAVFIKMIDPHKFLTLDYLTLGTSQQQEVYQLLIKSELMCILTAYHPVLAGTVPLDINIQGSDLDIICEFDDRQQFKELLISHFANHPNFQISELLVHGRETIIANFYVEGWEIEVFGQAVPVVKQAAYRHLLAEYNLLRQHGDWLKEEVIKLKKNGYKTEPAFAKALGLSGDPYEALFAFENK
jgi:hypothetical protein